jgi:hypothetical protein
MSVQHYSKMDSAQLYFNLGLFRKEKSKDSSSSWQLKWLQVFPWQQLIRRPLFADFYTFPLNSMKKLIAAKPADRAA